RFTADGSAQLPIGSAISESQGPARRHDPRDVAQRKASASLEKRRRPGRRRRQCHHLIGPMEEPPCLWRYSLPTSTEIPPTSPAAAYVAGGSHVSSASNWRPTWWFAKLSSTLQSGKPASCFKFRWAKFATN